MNELNYKETALFEHRFWLQVLGDHARFIFESLSRKAIKETKLSFQFIKTFDQLLHYARQDLASTELMELNKQANHYASEIRLFKLELIRQHLTGMIYLPPTFLNHMVNEVEEYSRILLFLIEEKTPPALHSIHHHLLWMSDASVHASAIVRTLDPIEKSVIQKSESFTKHFDNFYLKAIELAGYMRSNLASFPVLDRFNHEVKLEMLLFKEFLDELEELGMTSQLLGNLSPLIVDHMAREGCYYLMKLAQVSNVKTIICDPTRPRPEK
ncbi:DUF2935 domain-containing protein [Bacillus taeanensis]|uniref:DUF2935 domain-containing protein n=1 Tax=Bacillus taeanensis TaxID=273032 RepID=A0A366XQA3_9BACI|nr:DUF2935 domain-containing protein [Bacillus taeanensis]RBW67896.1 hypothetical protein DS031_19635 [Bacillus taeanensis]